jgi:alkanesulfonate monooxygenase SsuD/methylene tetrahydromethanopterin reductase-like flavin-dependent oxidoreductase (luciferase family)
MASSSGIIILRGAVRALGDAARGAEDAGYAAVWTPEFYTRSAIVTLAHLASQTTTVRLGTSIAYAVGLHPREAGRRRGILPTYR